MNHDWSQVDCGQLCQHRLVIPTDLSKREKQVLADLFMRNQRTIYEDLWQWFTQQWDNKGGKETRIRRQKNILYKHEQKNTQENFDSDWLTAQIWILTSPSFMSMVYEYNCNRNSYWQTFIWIKHSLRTANPNSGLTCI